MTRFPSHDESSMGLSNIAWLLFRKALVTLVFPVMTALLCGHTIDVDVCVFSLLSLG